MGQIYSSYYDEGQFENYKETEGGISFELLISNPTKLLPLKLSSCKYQTTRFLWHFQTVDRRRQEFVQQRVDRAHEHNTTHVGTVQTRKEFKHLCRIDFAIFDERRVKKTRSAQISRPKIYDTRRVTQNKSSKNDFKRNNRNSRRHKFADTHNYDYYQG